MDADSVRHPYEDGERPRSHLLHDMLAVDLDRALARTQLSCDLLVEEPCHHERHHFPLARSQPTISTAQLGDLGPLLARVAVTFERLLNRVEQLLVTEGLGQELDR